MLKQLSSCRGAAECAALSAQDRTVFLRVLENLEVCAAARCFVQLLHLVSPNHHNSRVGLHPVLSPALQLLHLTFLQAVQYADAFVFLATSIAYVLPLPRC